MEAGHSVSNNKVCAINECNRPNHSKGFCSMHGHRINRQNGLEIEMPEKSIWRTMKARCYNSNNDKYHRYGARGIIVCDRWINSFDNFLKDMGPRPSDKHSIERKDNNGDYEPNNCRWATFVEQANNRSNNFLITIRGDTKTLVQWCEIYPIEYGTAWNRIKVLGMNPLKALTEPLANTKDTCKRGHHLSGDNLRINPKTSQRVCRTCEKDRMSKFKLRRKLNV